MRIFKRVCICVSVMLVMVAILATTVSAEIPRDLMGGVNFANMESQSTTVKITPYSNGIEGQSSYYDVEYSKVRGGFTIDGLSYYLADGDVLLISFDVQNYDGSSVLKYCNGSSYFFSCGVSVSDGANTYNLRQERLAFKNGDTTQYAGNGTASATLTHVPVSNIDVSAVNRTGIGIFIDSIRLHAFTIYQWTPIYSITWLNNASHVEQGYVPYYTLWFEEVETDYDEGYTVGYNKGYEQGAIDAGGGVMQRWGAFLITATQGFMEFEIFPNMPLWGLLAVAIAIPLFVLFLKQFVGG